MHLSCQATTLSPAGELPSQRCAREVSISVRLLLSCGLQLYDRLSCLAFLWLGPRRCAKIRCVSPTHFHTHEQEAEAAKAHNCKCKSHSRTDSDCSKFPSRFSHVLGIASAWALLPYLEDGGARFVTRRDLDHVPAKFESREGCHHDQCFFEKSVIFGLLRQHLTTATSL